MPIKKIEKQELIKRCVPMFRAKGLHNTSINDLAQATGLSKSLFYHHFDNKDELIKASLNIYSDYFFRNVFDEIETCASPRKKLEYMTQKAEKLLLKDWNGCLMGNTVLETQVDKTTYQEVLNHFFDGWIRILNEVLEENKLNLSSKILAERSVMLIEGALILSKLKKEKRYLKDAFLHINSWL